ncbi:hypothetical protein GOP47_0029162 [Adiantum capillus-veneris]|nr:hypothetical protein GOP47_0029162 [Adiantum capillus-veneris]
MRSGLRNSAACLFQSPSWFDNDPTQQDSFSKSRANGDAVSLRSPATSALKPFMFAVCIGQLYVTTNVSLAIEQERPTQIDPQS